MDSMKDLISEAGLSDVHQIVGGAERHICYARLAGDKWVLGASDGIDVWRAEMTVTDLNNHRDLADVNTLDAYLGRFRSSFNSGDITIGKEGFMVNLKIGHGAKALDFELYEAKAMERKNELKIMLFSLAERSSDLSSKLQTANKKLDSLKIQQPSGNTAMFDLEGKKNAGKSQANKAAPKKVGMSLVNPSSKKRKAAQGIEFE